MNVKSHKMGDIIGYVVAYWSNCEETEKKKKKNRLKDTRPTFLICQNRVNKRPLQDFANV